MTWLRYLYRSLVHYGKSNLLVSVGTAICTMVLTGTLIVGDSMRASLEKATELRLGKINHVFSAEGRYFQSSLANHLRDRSDLDVAALLVSNGMAIARGGEMRLGNIQVVGIDEHFTKMTSGGEFPSYSSENEVFISQNLSQRLNIQKGDFFQLRIEKGSLIPKNAPFISDQDVSISLRLQVGAVLSDDMLGRFNLKISQTAPFNVFIARNVLGKKSCAGWKIKYATFLRNSHRG